MLPSLKQAKLTVEAMSRSFSMPPEDCRIIVANCLGKSNWDTLVDSCGREKVLPEQSKLTTYLDVFQTRLAEILEVEDPRIIKELVLQVHPWQQKPKAYRFDQTTSTSDDSIDLGGIFRDMNDMLEGENGAADLLRTMMGDNAPPEMDEFIESLGGTSTSDFQDRMRISVPLEPEFYYNALANCTGWQLGEDIDDFEHGLPVFEYIDQHGEEQPVFLNSIASSPGDSADKMLLSVIEMVEDGYELDFQKPLLLFRTPISKELGGKRFAVIGLHNQGDGWRWLFLSKLTPPEQVRVYPHSLIGDLDNTLESPTPPAELALHELQEGLPADLGYMCIISPTKQPKEDNGKVGFVIESRPMITGVGGWSSFI